MKLSEHAITLHGSDVTLRAMTENDWQLLLSWNNDPDVLYYADGNTVDRYTLAEIQSIYRSVSQTAICFIIETQGTPIGEGWLQQMNLPHILEKYPNRDCRRIDLMIGDKQFWGHGFGTDVIRTLTRFGFESEGADLIFGCDIADYNARSLRAFQRVGYQIDMKRAATAEDIAAYRYDLAIARTGWANVI